MDLAFYEAIGETGRTRSRKRGRVRTSFDLIASIYSAAAPKKKKKRKSPLRRSSSKNPLGTKHEEFVCSCGPYVTGFYYVKNFDGRVGVFRRSAARMRQFALRKDPTCP